LGGYAAREGEKRRVGIRAIEAVENGKSDDVDLRVLTDSSEGQETYSRSQLMFLLYHISAHDKQGSNVT
jgi:hypothetical protein